MTFYICNARSYVESNSSLFCVGCSEKSFIRLDDFFSLDDMLSRLRHVRQSWHGLARHAKLHTKATTTTKQDEPADAGLNAFLVRVYKTAGTGVFAMFGTSAVCCVTTMPAVHHYEHLGVGALGAIACALALEKVPPEFFEEDKQVVLKDNHLRTGLFYGIFSFMGVLVSPSVYETFAVEPMVLPLAGLASVLTMCGATFCAHRAGNKLLTWQPALSGSLWGLIGVAMVSIGAHKLGYPNVAHALFNVETYVLFCTCMLA